MGLLGYATVGVVIATFGDDKKWAPLAERALASVERQTLQPHQIILYHGETLAEARNSAIKELDTPRVVVLDADDELDENYLKHMMAMQRGDVRWPSTLGVYPDGSEDDAPVLIEPKRNLLVGNHCVIGSMFRKHIFEKVGGFRDLPMLEDWDLWIRMWLEGCRFAPCPEAIYRVHVNPNSRNTDLPEHGRIYTQIQRTYEQEAAAKGLLR